MLANVRRPLRSRVAPVAPNLPPVAASAREAVADPAYRHTAIHRVMLAHGHPIHREGV